MVASACKKPYTPEVKESFPDGSPKLIHYFSGEGAERAIKKLEEYYNNGELRMRGHYKDGLKHGVWKSWHKGGKVWSVANYYKGKLDGKQTVYHPNGNKFYQGSYDRGMRIGEWKFWNEEGEMTNSVQY